MKRRAKNYRKQSQWKEIIKSHLENNFKLYVIAGIVFLIGIILGILFVNNISATQVEELKMYINQLIEEMKLNNVNYLKELITENILIILILWFAGLTIIGIIINYVFLIFKGFCIGYAISAISLALGTWKGIAFVFITMFFQNLLLIPAIIATTVSGMRFLKAIIQNRRKESVIIEVISHTLFSTLMLAIMICSAFVEIYLSNQLLGMTINFF